MIISTGNSWDLNIMGKYLQTVTPTISHRIGSIKGFSLSSTMGSSKHVIEFYVSIPLSTWTLWYRVFELSIHRNHAKRKYGCAWYSLVQLHAKPNFCYFQFNCFNRTDVVLLISICFQFQPKKHEFKPKWNKNAKKIFQWKLTKWKMETPPSLAESMNLKSTFPQTNRNPTRRKQKSNIEKSQNFNLTGSRRNSKGDWWQASGADGERDREGRRMADVQSWRSLNLSGCINGDAEGGGTLKLKQKGLRFFFFFFFLFFFSLSSFLLLMTNVRLARVLLVFFFLV